MKSANIIVKSIFLYTFEAWNSDGIPMILNGLKVEYWDSTNEKFIAQFLFENYNSLECFSDERGGGIKVLSQKSVFSNYSSSLPKNHYLVGMQMIESFKIAFNLQEVEAVHTKYRLDKCYGLYAVEKLDEMVSEEVQDEDRQHRYKSEFFYGQYQKASREYYS